MIDNSIHGSNEFDFNLHKSQVTLDYLNVYNYYKELSLVKRHVLEECLKVKGIKIHSIQARAKDPNSFAEKAIIPRDDNPNLPKYNRPLTQITDLSGVRIIAFFIDQLNEIDTIIHDNFTVIEKSDKGKDLLDSDKFGYTSVHYLIKLNEARGSLPEYSSYKNGISELQVRTILQHAWAEIEHDIQYKSSTNIPPEIHRRFLSLAGMLEIADREFQAIKIAEFDFDKKADDLVKSGNPDNVYITPRALKSFLDLTLGSDGRVSSWSYEWTAKICRELGFKDISQIQKCISPYIGKDLSLIVFGTRQGQITRFQEMLRCGMGNLFLERHPWSKHSWFENSHKYYLSKYINNSISIGNFDPSR